MVNHEIYKDSLFLRWSKDPAKAAELLFEAREAYDDLKPLPPSGKRLLLKLVRLFEQNRFEPVDREQIAKALGRPGTLTPWDRRLLKQLDELVWISIYREPLSMYRRHGHRCPRGAKWMYAMDEDAAFLVHFILENQQKVLKTKRKVRS